MINQVQIHPDISASNKEKGDFFEDLLRSIMETQRYQVTTRVNFTGTEIDLLCDHLDRPDDHALVECKARINLNSDDIKNFSFDILVAKRAEYGFFVHTTEIKSQAAGLVRDLKDQYPKQLIFWGPDKVIELLEHCKLIQSPISLPVNQLTHTKQILVYSFHGRFWVTILSNQIVPTHYHISDATNPNAPISNEVLEWIKTFDELQGLSRFELENTAIPSTIGTSLDAVAEVQEATQWADCVE